MRSVFDSPEWHEQVAALVRASDSRSCARQLLGVIEATVANNGIALLAFHRHAAPEVVIHSLTPKSAQHYLDRYLAGPYLLDPLYELALKAKKPQMCRFRDTQPDRFRSSEYYRQYAERTHLVDEVDFLLNVSRTSTLVIVCGRMERKFSQVELARLKRIESIVISAMQRTWDMAGDTRAPGDRGDDMHQRLQESFDNFGSGILTNRERQITHLLLRGHSSKSIARELGIAPGTVMVHKRNLFAKLGITSQYELFSSFIDTLSAQSR